MLKNRRKTENIKKERKKCREKKKRKTYSTVLGLRQCFALRNQGNVPDAFVDWKSELSPVDGDVVNRMTIRSSAWWNLLFVLRRPQLKDRPWIQITNSQVNDCSHFSGCSEANVSLSPYFSFISQSCLANSWAEIVSQITQKGKCVT